MITNMYMPLPFFSTKNEGFDMKEYFNREKWKFYLKLLINVIENGRPAYKLISRLIYRPFL